MTVGVYNNDELQKNKIYKGPDSGRKQIIFGGIVKKMFRSDTNMIRPRRITQSWTNHNGKISGSVFKIGELTDYTLSLPKTDQRLM